MKENYLTKDQIKSIKYFIKCEAEYHKCGSYDRFRVKILQLRSNGDYLLSVNYWIVVNNRNESYYLQGNLFNEFPRNAVMDGLDVVKLLFYKVRYNAYIRTLKYTIDNCIRTKQYFNYIKNIDYKPGSALNKENKILKDLSEEQEELFNRTKDDIDNLKYIE